jgi:hypothetical protein
MTEVWKATVLEVHGLFNGNEELGPLDIVNAWDRRLPIR